MHLIDRPRETEPWQRQGFLVSAILHLLVIMALTERALAPAKEPPPPPRPQVPPEEMRRRLVFLPPPEVLERLAPPPRPRPPAPATPAPAGLKDRVSVGGPSESRQRVLELRRDQEVQARAGRTDVTPEPLDEPATQEGGRNAPLAGGKAGRAGEPAVAATGSGSIVEPGERGAYGSGSPAPPRAPSIASSLQNLERRLQQQGALGLPTGTGRQIGPMFFDPRGADFTLWVNDFKNEVYRNWILPQAALMGIQGHVDLECTVERDGRISALRLLKSSGTPSLDRAARNALIGARLSALPADYGPPQLTFQVTFFYGEGPRSS